MWKSITRDLHRTLTIALLGILMIMVAKHLPMVEPGEFSFAPSITFLGGCFIAVAFSHVLRRLLFPSIDLQSFMRQAFSDPVGAGLVAVGICYVLGTLISANAELFVR